MQFRWSEGEGIWESVTDSDDEVSQSQASLTTNDSEEPRMERLLRRGIKPEQAQEIIDKYDEEKQRARVLQEESEE